MSFFLTTAAASLRRYGGSAYDPDFQAKIDYADVNGITKPSEAQLAIENQRLIDYKATGAWDKDDCYFDFTGVGDTCIPWRLLDTKRLVQADAYGGLVWSSEGVKGNGTNGYIDIMFDPSINGVNYQNNNASIGYSLFNVGTSGAKAIIGGAVLASRYTLIAPNNTSSSYFMINTNGLYDFNQTYHKTGYTQIDRISSAQMQLDGGSIYATNSGGLTDMKLTLFARNGATPDMYSDAGVSFMALGGDKSSEYDAIKSVLE